MTVSSNTTTTPSSPKPVATAIASGPNATKHGASAVPHDVDEGSDGSGDGNDGGSEDDDGCGSGLGDGEGSETENPADIPSHDGTPVGPHVTAPPRGDRLA
jgi:hypothetical protein